MIKFSGRRRWLIILFLIVMASGGAGAAVYFYQQYQQAQRLLRDPDAATRAEVKKVLDQLGTLIELPSTEEPTVATVSDKDKLKDQPFFARAENGDKVLIYAQAKKAILYRPSTNKIIDVAPVNLGSPSPSADLLPSPVTTPVLLPSPTSTSAQ